MLEKHRGDDKGHLEEEEEAASHLLTTLEFI